MSLESVKDLIDRINRGAESTQVCNDSSEAFGGCVDLAAGLNNHAANLDAFARSLRGDGHDFLAAQAARMASQIREAVGESSAAAMSGAAGGSEER